MGRFLCTAAAALALSGGAWAGPGAAGTPLAQASAPVCGEHMMSAQERDEHRRRMHEAASAAERERIRKEHRERMIERARERGLPWHEGPDCRAPRPAA
ncbi:MAG TPA: hypothetical protein VNV16_09545 [Methylibium sp.]|nr:hypothetical protein [Methylibium sp.]